MRNLNKLCFEIRIFFLLYRQFYSRGALLYQVSWLPNSTYGDIANQYTEHILHKYGEGENISVIFDGYDDPLSTKATKAHEHVRRSGICSADVNVKDSSMKVTTSRKLFLKNTNNKKELIKVLSSRFSEKYIGTDQSTGDADVLTVKKALDVANSKEVCVVSDDTDVLVLLMHHWRPTMKNILFSTTKTINNKKVPVQYSVRDLVNKHPLTRFLLFAHAWTGCDTTSATYKKGKTKIFQHLKTKLQQDAISCFGDVFATQEVIAEAGINLFIKSYKGNDTDTLADLRYEKFIQMLTTTAIVEPSELPPTERAAHYHALHVHLQVTQWVTLDLHCLDPTKWGWKVENGQLAPIKTDLAPAPDFLLNFIRCNCQPSIKNPCGGLNCSCRKHGLECVIACGNCHGQLCMNIVVVEDIEKDDYEDVDRNVFDLFV